MVQKMKYCDLFKIVKKKKKMAINIKNIETSLYSNSPDPDILIRTGKYQQIKQFFIMAIILF